MRDKFHLAQKEVSQGRGVYRGRCRPLELAVKHARVLKMCAPLRDRDRSAHEKRLQPDALLLLLSVWVPEEFYITRSARAILG